MVWEWMDLHACEYSVLKERKDRNCSLDGPTNCGKSSISRAYTRFVPKHRKATIAPSQGNC
jgi:hypothetical protein